jgi:DNA-directed RNA polymerase subunit M/transcription elongation factor TFIIS
MDKQRQITINAFASACENYEAWNELPIEIQNTKLKQIERSCYNRTVLECKLHGEDRFWENPLFTNKYSIICSKIMSNLDITSIVNVNQSDPSYTISAIINDNISLDTISNLTSYELNPQCSETLVKEISERKLIKLEEKFSERKECPSCHARKTKFTEVQTRSGDEPASIKYTCLNCSKEWFG